MNGLKVENERLRGLLQQAIEMIEEQELHIAAEMLPAGRVLVEEIKAALSQQAEPAPAQDEREAFEECWAIRGTDDEGNLGRKPLRSLVDQQRYRGDAVNGSWVWFQRGAAWQRNHLAQTAPQVVALPAYRATPDQSTFKLKADWQNQSLIDAGFNTALDEVARMNTPQPEQSGWISVEGCEP